MSTFITVGTSRDPFPRLLDEAARLLECGVFPAPVIVQHGSTPFTSAGCIAKAFIDRTEFDTYLSQATLIITHGGLTVARALRLGRTPVVMPRRAKYHECIDDHQLSFAEALAIQGRVALAREPSDLSSAVSLALSMQAERGSAQDASAEPLLVGEIRQLLDTWSQQRR